MIPESIVKELKCHGASVLREERSLIEQLMAVISKSVGPCKPGHGREILKVERSLRARLSARTAKAVRMVPNGTATGGKAARHAPNTSARIKSIKMRKVK